MKRRSFGMLCVALAVAAVPIAVASAQSTSTTAQVSPGSGGIRTSFTVRFTIPDTIGPREGVGRSDSLLVSGPTHTGCVGHAALPLRAAAAHHTFAITLNPANLNGHWCIGTFTGMLVERESTICSPGPVNIRPSIVCPEYLLAPRVLARFSFRVTAPAPARRSHA